MTAKTKAAKESLGDRNRRFEKGLLSAAKRSQAPAHVALRRVLTAAVYAVLPGAQKRRHIDAELEVAYRAARDAASRKFTG